MSSSDQWAHARLSVSVHPTKRRQGAVCVDWRLEAKAPGDQWSLKHTVGFGSVLMLSGWPPSRDDVQYMMTELLMGMRWDESGVTL